MVTSYVLCISSMMVMVVVVDGCTLGAGLVPAACGVATQLPQHRLYLPPAVAHYRCRYL